jgi:hypothetical protein
VIEAVIAAEFLGTAPLAFAADMSLKALAPVGALPSWTGFTSVLTVVLRHVRPVDVLRRWCHPRYFSNNVTGSSGTTAIADFHAAYNYQMSPIWVLGV